MNATLAATLTGLGEDWDRFLAGLGGESPLRPFIEQSWERCRAVQVDPEHAPLHRVADEDLRRRLHENREFLAVARPHLDWISATLAATPHVLYLTDREGVVLHSTGNAPELIRDYGLSPGYDWSEARMGTNGAGTALATGEPTVVVGPEHFVRAFQGCTCTAAPIRDPEGALLGALDLTTANLPGVPERLTLVAYATHTIERELAAQRAASDQVSEEWLRLAMDAGRLGAWELDLREGSVRWDERAQAIFGRKVIGRITAEDAMAGIHPGDREAAERAVAAALAPDGAGSYEIEKRIVWPDGTVRWVFTRGQTLFEGEGDARRPVRILGTVADITAQREAVERVRLQYRLLDAVGHAVIATDAEGAVTYWNRAAEQLYGWTKEEALGRPVVDLTPADGSRAQAAAIMQRLRAGEEWSGEFLTRKKDGSSFPVYVMDTPVLDEAGELVGIIGVSWDLTEQKREAEALREAKREAERANRSKTEFLSAMSHELRTPLNAVAGYLDLLDLGVHGPMTEAQKHALSRIKHNQEHLLTLITDILHFAKVESGSVEFRNAPILLDEFLSGMAALVEPQVQARSLTYGYRRCDPELTAWGDRNRVRQVLLNLVSNAVKFTEPGGRIELSVDFDDAWVYLHVSDTGRGIPADRLAAIFEPFVQVEPWRDQPDRQGVGLGLAISRDLSRGMGGDLSVESRLGAGSTFTLRLLRTPWESPATQP